MMVTLIATIVAAVATQNGVVLTTDTSRGPNHPSRLASISSRTAIAGGGYDSLRVRAPVGDAFLVDYSFPRMVDDLKRSVGPAAPPTRVASAARDYLANTFKNMGDISPARFVDIHVLVGGIEGGGQPGVWNVTVHLYDKKLPVRVTNEKQTALAQLTWQVTAGIHTGFDEIEKGWRERAPARLGNKRPEDYSLLEKADIIGLQIAIDTETNPYATTPIEQIVLTATKQPQRRVWTPLK